MREMQVFGVERLEDRLLMAVNITQNGNVLVIEGDAADERIEVLGTGEGEVSVYVDADGDNIPEFVLYGEYSGVKHVCVSSGDGDDDIYLQLDIDGHLTVNGGDGDDKLVVVSDIGGNVSVDGGDGDDYVVIAVAEIDGKLTIDTGDGFDDVYLSGGVDVDGKTLIDTGAGDDRVLVYAYESDIELADLVISTGDGSDRVHIASGLADVTIEGRTDIMLGFREDILNMSEGFGGSVNFVGNFSADGGARDDDEFFDDPGDAFFGDKFTLKDFESIIGL
jgi:hypothetical protein